MLLPDADPCLIEPRRGRSEEALPPSAILVFSPEDLRSFLDCFSAPVKKTHKLYLSEVFTGTFEGTPIAIAGPMLGAPQTILVLERMIAMGARHIVAAGWCGSLQKHVRIGDIVLPTGAVSEEGTSRHYRVKSTSTAATPLADGADSSSPSTPLAGGSDRGDSSSPFTTGAFDTTLSPLAGTFDSASPPLARGVRGGGEPSGAEPTEDYAKIHPLRESLNRNLRASGLTVHRGTVWTTDAPFRETIAKVKQFQLEGVLSVDMETSALFSVAAFRRIGMDVVLVVSDDLSGLKWVHGFREPLFKEARRKVVRSTLEVVCSAAASLTHS